MYMDIYELTHSQKINNERNYSIKGLQYKMYFDW